MGKLRPSAASPRRRRVSMWFAALQFMTPGKPGKLAAWGDEYQDWREKTRLEFPRTRVLLAKIAEL
jgi:hypothetical protein